MQNVILILRWIYLNVYYSCVKKPEYGMHGTWLMLWGQSSKVVSWYKQDVNSSFTAAADAPPWCYVRGHGRAAATGESHSGAQQTILAGPLTVA